MLQFANDNKGSDVVESPAVCGPIQLNGKPAPSLDRLLLSLGFESHEHILPDLLQRPIEGLLELRVRTQVDIALLDELSRERDVVLSAKAVRPVDVRLLT
ncbi:MAG: hypothetical protein DMF89_08015 [Acidobacteria bacterium]|nr:MAG: hypothetical protein DMF89_08015 [Acidobacteriota bacterium]